MCRIKYYVIYKNQTSNHYGCYDQGCERDVQVQDRDETETLDFGSRRDQDQGRDLP